MSRSKRPADTSGRPYLVQVGAPPPSYQPLPAAMRADSMLSRSQVAFLITMLALMAFGLGALWHYQPESFLMRCVQIVMNILTILNFLIIAYKLYLLVRGLGQDKSGQPDDLDLTEPPANGWPSYNIIVPGFREPPEVIKALIGHIQALDYPADKLHVRLAVEHDDLATIELLRGMKLPDYMKVVVCPPRQPTTKPGACQYVLLSDAPGELTVIYDIEDIPDPQQLKLAAKTFMMAPPSVVCLQAQLQYHNVSTNLLTRLFSSEYAAHFGLILRGLHRAGLPIPLGGTSNHFPTEALLQLGGWDGFNVTEDATLGYTIARRGWRVWLINSVTLEEANTRIGNWIRQRSRWIKGYMQTYIVHMRHPWRLWRELGTAGFVSFQMMIGYATFTIMVNPLLWVLTSLYFLSRIAGWSAVATGIESLFPPAVYYMGILSMLVGNLMVAYLHLAGAMERRLHNAMLAVALLPAYWCLMCIAACKAFYELLHRKKRHSWQHTQHGLDEAPDSFHAAMEEPEQPARLAAEA